MGAILLIHGSAPFNKDGRVPDDRAGKYAKMSFYKDLAVELENYGWDVFRYSKAGVSNDNIDFSEYKKTDLSHIEKQIKNEWIKLPSDKPRFVFAWSEGSLHASLLPLDQLSGVIILGGISTNIHDVILWQAKDNKKQMLKKINKIEKMPRDQMLGLDRPVGRLIDEFRLKDNWKNYRNYSNLPMLVIHGGADSEVPLNQSLIWKEKLPKNKIKLVTKKDRNHTFGMGDRHNAKEIVQIIQEWNDELSNH